MIEFHLSMQMNHNLSHEPPKAYPSAQSSAHSSASSGNNSPTHPMKVNQAEKEIFTADYSTSSAGHTDQASKTDAKLQTKPNPQKLTTSNRNISDFSTQQRQS